MFIKQNKMETWKGTQRNVWPVSCFQNWFKWSGSTWGCRRADGNRTAASAKVGFGWGRFKFRSRCFTLHTSVKAEAAAFFFKQGLTKNHFYLMPRVKGQLRDSLNRVTQKNIAKGTTDPRDEYISQSQFIVHKSWTYYNIRISIKHLLQNLNQTSATQLNLKLKSWPNLAS